MFILSTRTALFKIKSCDIKQCCGQVWSGYVKIMTKPRRDFYERTTP
jgi:hypothetical protein